MAVIPLGFFDPPSSVFLEAASWILRLFWTFDMALTFNSGFMTSDGAIELRRKKIVSRYLRTWFILDVLVVSVDWIEFFVSAVVSEGLSMARFGKVGRILRILRLFRLLRLARMSEVLNNFTE